MTNDQTTPAPVEVTALEPCPFCGSWDMEVQSEEYVHCKECLADGPYFADGGDRTAEAIAAWNTRHSAPAGEVEPVLRWEGDSLYLGDVAVGEVWRGLAQWGWVISLGAKVTEGFVPTKTEACTAAEQAVRDWITRAGLYTHPAPPADLVELVEAAWRAGFQTARECLPDDAADVLTEDVEHDAWLDSDTRALLVKHGGA